jgi:enoyl-CoA hydratase
MEYVALWNAAMLMSEDLAEAVMAFQKKRPPTFRD